VHASAHRDDGSARAVLCVPMLDRGHVIGVLVADRATAFTDDCEELALSIADEAKARLNTERLLDDVAREREHTARVHASTKALVGLVKQDDIAAAAMDAVVRLCPAASVAVYLHERLDGQNTLHNVGHRHFASGPPSSLALVDDSTWLCRAVQQGAVLPHVALLKAPARGLFTANDNACDAADARCFPLLARGEVVGALVVALIHVDDNARLRRSSMPALPSPTFSP
jgi:GAF domain